MLEYIDPLSDMSLVVEDDDRVAYAYLRQGTRIVGDVWLYNVQATPDVVDWSNRALMPFLNPRKYVREEPPIRVDSSICVSWTPTTAYVLRGDVLIARVEIGRRPGWSRQARIAGPLALPLESA